jgi:hypothetical protein
MRRASKAKVPPEKGHPEILPLHFRIVAIIGSRPDPLSKIHDFYYRTADELHLPDSLQPSA